MRRISTVVFCKPSSCERKPDMERDVEKAAATALCVRSSPQRYYRNKCLRNLEVGEPQTRRRVTVHIVLLREPEPREATVACNCSQPRYVLREMREEVYEPRQNHAR